MTTREASRRLGVAPRHLYALIDRGELPAFRFGRDIRLRPLDVDAYLRDHPAH